MFLKACLLGLLLTNNPFEIRCQKYLSYYFTGTLSIARAIAQHQSNDPTSLNFSNGKDIRVTAKLDNPHADLWGGEVSGREIYLI